MLDVSNARPIGILAGYLTACAALTAISINSIRRQAAASKHVSRRRNAILVFSALAVLSLATTWYHMFCFFQWSYQQWESGQMCLVGDELHLGEWLRDTTLFKQAWVSTLEQPPRAWWSLQVFGFCSIWSVMLAAQDKKGRIPHLWIFMLLGQIVAISFAANLSFLAFTVFEEATPSVTASKKVDQNASSKKQPTKGLSWLRFSWLVVLGITIGCAIAIPKNLDHPYFMYLLLAPHVLAFVPLLLNKLTEDRDHASVSQQPPLSVRVTIMGVLISAAITNLTKEGGNWEDVKTALYEHPAVSSVGWDVICCWISFVAWHILG
ncbi:hypothetical protein FSARC_5002 [Fusarium sarcochroum]|uniref:Alpha-mannosyltransferase alg11p n=1 Tax=Fusarium sarcochroum TaxID=1208366 RepID=A0A8H4XAV3_9HYPO|nr:hypothetical protein FSARC_5002 [Fusarium sarcochroum]